MQTIRFLLLFEAATFAAAALIHFGVIAAGHEHQKAGVAESAIAAVLFTGAILDSRTWTRRIGLAAQAFALLGTLIGVFTIIIGIGPRTAPDIAYHVAIVAVLIWGLVAAARSPTGDAAP
jgi:prepilin signal peptidase PulO-like enzyme (type II secretory pathway)